MPRRPDVPIVAPNGAFRLLAVDPSLSAAGFVVADACAHELPVWVRAGTVSTNPARPMPERLAVLYRETAMWYDENVAETNPGNAPTWAVLEDPGGNYGIRNGRSIYAMGLGVGAILCALGLRLPADHIALVRPSTYLPKPKRNTLGRIVRGRDQVITAGRRMLPADWRVSEHVCMAAYLARWWTT